MLDLRQRHTRPRIIPQVLVIVEDLEQGLRERRVCRPLLRDEEAEYLLPYRTIGRHQERQARALRPELLELLEVLERPLGARERADIQVLERHEEGMEPMEQRGHISHRLGLISPRYRKKILRIPGKPGLHDDRVGPRPDLRWLVERNYAVDEEVPRQALYTNFLRGSLISVDQDHVRMDPHEAIAEFCVIFLRKLRDLVRVLFHPSAPRGILGLQSLSCLPHCRQ